ncbi:MAG: SDR family oxidoreductase [Polyangia bacterium]
MGDTPLDAGAIRQFRSRYGPWALVTGASSGIGAEFARQLAARGLDVILCARRREPMEKLAAQLTAEHGVKAHVVSIDLSQPDFLDALRPELVQRQVGLLVSCAGFALTGPLLAHREEAELALFDTNCRAPLRLLHLLVPPMVSRRSGGVIVVSSITALLPVPYWTGYAASKAHGLAIAQGLAHELRGSGVDVLAVCPGSTATEFHSVAGCRDDFCIPAPVVVRAALSALGRRQLVLPGLQAKFLYGLSRLLPRSLMVRIWAHVVRGMANSA